MYSYGTIVCVIIIGVHNMKQIFDSCNLDDFDNQLISADICKMKLQYIEYSELKKKLNSKPKLRTYKQFKSEKQIENYIKLNLSNKESSFLAQLKMGTLLLFIETGRHTKVPIKHRFCFSCPKLKMNFISVFHVLSITNLTN